MPDVVVIGGGPAGMAAALHAADNGADVILLEQRSDLGGQYWRGQSGAALRGHDHRRGEKLRQTLLAHPKIDIRTGVSVWNVTYSSGVSTIRTIVGSNQNEITTERLVIATGAHDRTFPFPGWTTPGVMTAGGVQALLKGQGTLIGRNVVLAGTGPFLLSVAAGLLEHDVKVTVIEASSILRWLRHPRILLSHPKKLWEALYYLGKVRKARHFHGLITSVSSDLEVAVDKKGITYRFPADAVGIGFGFVPDLSVALSIGVECELDDGNLVVAVNEKQETSLVGVYAAGETTGIAGVEASLVEGAIAGLAAVGASIPDQLIKERRRWKRFAAALADVYPRPKWIDHLTPETVVCRCEEVTVASIDSALSDLSALDSRSVKLMSRTGMGLCQGRFCAQSVAAIVAERQGHTVTAQDLLTQRPIITPIPLGQMRTEQESAIPQGNSTD